MEREGTSTGQLIALEQENLRLSAMTEDYLLLSRVAELLQDEGDELALMERLLEVLRLLKHLPLVALVRQSSAGVELLRALPGRVNEQFSGQMLPLSAGAQAALAASGSLMLTSDEWRWPPSLSQAAGFEPQSWLLLPCANRLAPNWLLLFADKARDSWPLPLLLRVTALVRQTMERIALQRELAAKVRELENANLRLREEMGGKRQSDLQLRRMYSTVNNSPDLIFWVNRAGKPVYANDSAAARLALSQDDLLAKAFSEIDLGLGSSGWAALWEILHDAPRHTSETVWRGGSGRRIPVESIATLVHFKGEAFVCLFGRDISERQVARQQLQEGENLHRALVESTDAIPWRFDLTAGKILYVGPQIEALFGYPLVSWLDWRGWLSRIDPQDHRLLETIFSTPPAEGTHQRIEFRVRCADDRVVWVRNVCTVVSCGESGCTTMIGFLFDISDLKRNEERLSELATKAQAAEQAKNHLLAMMSDDIRTPLDGVIGVAELLLDSPLDNQQRDYVQTIQRSGHTLLAMLDGMLAASRGEGGAGSIATSPPSQPAAATSADASSHHWSGRVLLVEDTPTSQLVATGILQALGLTVETAVDGEEAVALCRHSRYDLIFMDLQLPKLNGYDAAKRIRVIERQKQRRRMPIVALTAHTQRMDELKSQEAGMDGFIAKPVTRQALQQVIQRWLVTPPSATAPLIAAEELPEAVDRAILTRLRHDLGFGLGPILDRFLADLPGMAAKLNEAAEQGGGEPLRRHAHRLKGACRSIGAVYLGNLCQRLEKEEEVAALLAAVANEEERVIEALNAPWTGALR